MQPPDCNLRPAHGSFHGWHRPLLIALCATCLTLAAGCGYEQSGNYSDTPRGDYRWQSLYRQDVQTIAVPIFTNKSFARGVEFKLTKAIVQQIEANTPYKVTSRRNADTILEGEITSVKTQTLSLSDRSALPQEQMLVVTVNFTWKDLRNGRILVERRQFDQSVAYYPTLGEGAVIGDLQASEKLAVGIVQELQADW